MKPWSRLWIRGMMGTFIAFVILSTVTFMLIYLEFVLDVTKAHKPGG